MPVTVKTDARNVNRHTQRGDFMVEQSLRRNGAGRSVLTDRDGTLIAGNLTTQKAVELGIPLREVHTDGTELIVVVRDDIAPGSVRARELAISDNRASEVSLDWDAHVLQDDLDSGVPLDLYWHENELADLLASDDIALSDDEQEALPADSRVRMCVELDGPTFERWTVYRDEMLALGLIDEGEVLKHLLDEAEG